LTALQGEIQRIKEIQRAGYIKGYQGVQMDKMEDSEIFNPQFRQEGDSKEDQIPRKTGVVGSRNLNMNDAHRAGLQQLKERDALIVSTESYDSLVLIDFTILLNTEMLLLKTL
jgi:hypothetical protein